MTDPIGYWIYDNADLFRYVGELSCMRDGAGRILLSGSFSSYMASLCRKIYPDARITAVSDRPAALEDARAEDPALETVLMPFEKYEGSSFDVVLSIFTVNTLDTRELTPYLFSLHDALNAGGNLFLSFPSMSSISPYPKKLVDAWYSMDEKVYMKRYAPEDVIMALSIIGFDVKAIESDDNPDVGKVTSIHAVKRS